MLHDVPWEFSTQKVSAAAGEKKVQIIRRENAAFGRRNGSRQTKKTGNMGVTKQLPSRIDRVLWFIQTCAPRASVARQSSVAGRECCVPVRMHITELKSCKTRVKHDVRGRLNAVDDISSHVRTMVRGFHEQESRSPNANT